jgi:hypothetical protein
MAELFATGRIVDLILVLMIAETLVLAGYRYMTGRGISIMPLLTNMAAGACLMLALRAALAGAPWTLIAIALGAAFGMHALDLRGRWPSSPVARRATPAGPDGFSVGLSRQVITSLVRQRRGRG